ncbi:unnamed protein product [Ixodes pacificus]
MKHAFGKRGTRKGGTPAAFSGVGKILLTEVAGGEADDEVEWQQTVVTLRRLQQKVLAFQDCPRHFSDVSPYLAARHSASMDKLTNNAHRRGLYLAYSSYESMHDLHMTEQWLDWGNALLRCRNGQDNQGARGGIQ